ncbi:MAG: hypothetical protein HOM25_10085 [Rhodospirillaceae bacterium]|jgi:hypothetical protein|nr:hypothetical protein [Rhodospirillaceae bacterium]MBT5667298.1 hypothetical protein [Rhodospirillaceae bacterium]MBT5811355.1 hypothetical protein [Rhodospirillaceae bacterium]
MINLPNMRVQLIGCLESLSDLAYQKKCWVLDKCPVGVQDNFNLSVHFFFDDTSLSENPHLLVGVCLRNENEAQAIQQVCQMIDKVFDEHGLDKSDEEYINCPEWGAVLNSASEALAIIRK